MGETEICGQPQKVVLLGPCCLEQVLALGVQPAGDHIALHQGDYDDPSEQIPDLGDRVTTHQCWLGLSALDRGGFQSPARPILPRPILPRPIQRRVSMSSLQPGYFPGARLQAQGD